MTLILGVGRSVWWLEVGSKLPEWELNLDHGGESTKSSPLDHPGTSG